MLAWALCLKTGAGSSSMGGRGGEGRQMPEEGADPVRKPFRRRQRATEAYLQQEEENRTRKLP